jgi:hypothetical protein
LAFLEARLWSSLSFFSVLTRYLGFKIKDQEECGIEICSKDFKLSIGMEKGGPGIGPGFGEGDDKLIINEFPLYWQPDPKAFQDFITKMYFTDTEFEGDPDPEEEETAIIEDEHYPIAGDRHLDKELRE